MCVRTFAAFFFGFFSNALPKYSHHHHHRRCINRWMDSFASISCDAQQSMHIFVLFVKIKREEKKNNNTIDQSTDQKWSFFLYLIWVDSESKPIRRAVDFGCVFFFFFPSSCRHSAYYVSNGGISTATRTKKCLRTFKDSFAFFVFFVGCSFYWPAYLLFFVYPRIISFTALHYYDAMQPTLN